MFAKDIANSVNSVNSKMDLVTKVQSLKSDFNPPPTHMLTYTLNTTHEDIIEQNELHH